MDKMNFIKIFSAMMVLLLTTTTYSKPEVWMTPPGFDNGKCFRELFDQPNRWKDARSKVDVLVYADHVLNRQFTDTELKKWFGMVNKWNIKFALEVGAIKEWGTTGKATFNVQKPMWDRFRSLGANIYAIALDEPLIATRHYLKKDDDYALRETADFIARVRKAYPDMLIGDIEPYPSISLKDHMIWIDSLEKRLAELKVRGLDFYRLDVDWVGFNIAESGTWKEMKKLEDYCKARKLKFSMVYWASDYPHLQNIGLADESTWYISIMRQGYDYALVGGAPDQYVIQSWLETPSKATPDSSGFSFTQSVRDFCRRFVK